MPDTRSTGLDTLDAGTTPGTGPAAAQPVLLEVREGVAWVRLNTPENLNALSSALLTALNDVLDVVEGDREVRVVIITGVGRAFSSGGDLSAFQQQLRAGDLAGLAAGVQRGSDTLSRIENLPKPVIAAVNGFAVAGGLELILCCDMVAASAGVRMGDGHLRYGVLPGAGGSVRLMRKIPPTAAKWLLMTGDLVPAERFLDWGLVNTVVPGELLEAAAAQLAASVARLSPLALAHVKQIATHANDRSVAVGLAQELSALQSYMRSHDFREGVDAFAEKRKPCYRGD